MVDRVAVGHTRSDQAETVLYRFLRGSGTAGLAGIRPITPLLVRPLLEIDRDQVEHYLTQNGIPWRTDSTNASLQFARNKLRHHLLPQLEAGWNPAIRQTLAHTAEWARAEEDYWSAEVERLAAGRVSPRHGGFLLSLDGLAGLPLAATRRLVRFVIQQAKGDTRGVDFHHISTVVALALQSPGTGGVDIPGLKVRRSFDWLLFRRAGGAPPLLGEYRIPVTVPGSIHIPGTDLMFCLELIEKAETFAARDCVYNSDEGWVDWGSLPSRLEFRNWLPGDRFQPAGSNRKEKIKTLFHQARTPLWERDRWPVLTMDGAIVWAWRFGADVGYAARPGTRTVLRIRETAGGTDLGIGSQERGV